MAGRIPLHQSYRLRFISCIFYLQNTMRLPVISKIWCWRIYSLQCSIFLMWQDSRHINHTQLILLFAIRIKFKVCFSGNRIRINADIRVSEETLLQDIREFVATILESKIFCSGYHLKTLPLLALWWKINSFFNKWYSRA